MSRFQSDKKLKSSTGCLAGEVAGGLETTPAVRPPEISDGNGTAPRPSASDMYDIVPSIRFGFRGVDVSDQEAHPCVIEPIPRASTTSRFTARMHVCTSSARELRLCSSTLGTIIGDQAQRLFPALSRMISHDILFERGKPRDFKRVDDSLMHVEMYIAKLRHSASAAICPYPVTFRKSDLQSIRENFRGRSVHHQRIIFFYKTVQRQCISNVSISLSLSLHVLARGIVRHRRLFSIPSIGALVNR